MKIGLLHYSMPPVIGGVERILAAHTRLFRAAGHEVVLFCDGRQGLSDPEFAFIAVSMGNAAEFVKLIVAAELDVLFVHNVLTMPFAPAATAACHELAASPLRVVSWVHDLAATNPYYKVAADSWLRRHPVGAEVVAISEARAAAYRDMTGFSDVCVIPNGLETGLPDYLRGAFPILFHPTRILRRKNIGLGLRVIAELKKIGLSPRLLISGAPEPFSGAEADYRRELEAIVKEFALESDVFFLGDEMPLTEPAIDTLYELADALFFPSEQEGFGLPVLEAGLRRLPLFVSASQPLADLAALHGVVFPLDLSPADLAARIADFFHQSPSSQVRQRIRRDFDWQGIYQTHILPLLGNFSP